jgi:hypothetical protein
MKPPDTRPNYDQLQTGVAATKNAQEPEIVAFEVRRSTAVAMSKCKNRFAREPSYAGSDHVQISE